MTATRSAPLNGWTKPAIGVYTAILLSLVAWAFSRSGQVDDRLDRYMDQGRLQSREQKRAQHNAWTQEWWTEQGQPHIDKRLDRIEQQLSEIGKELHAK